MTWLTPAYAAIAASIAIPALVILYFLKLRRRDLEISTTLLWRKAIQDLQANAPFQRLRRNILLLLQLLVLAAALTALGQPEFKADTRTGTRRIILIDRSASMSSTDGAAGKPVAPSTPISRLDQAKKDAIELVDSMRDPGVFDEKGDEAMVIAFDTTAEVRQNFTSDKAQLRAAVKAIEPTDAPSAIGEAFKLAKAYTGTRKFEEGKGFVPASAGAAIHIFSDGRLPDAEKATVDPEDKVSYHAVGAAETPNIGITGLRAERAFDNPSKLSIFVGLQSTARQQRTLDVQLAIDEQVAAVRAVTLPAATPGTGAGAAPEPAATPAPADAAGKPADKPDKPNDQPWTPGVGGVVFTLDRVEGGIVTVQLKAPADGSGPDALPADDTAYLVFPPAKRLAVALVSGGNLFLQTALEGLNLSKLVKVPAADFQRLLDANQTGEFDVVVFDGWLPNVKPAPAAGAPAPGAAPAAPPAPAPGLPPGRYLVMNIVPPPPLGLIDNGPGEPAVIVDWSRDHPALRLAGLDQLEIVKSRKTGITPDSPVRAIASDQLNLPAIAEITDAATHAIVVPFDPADTNWPFQPGFVLFLAGAITHLSDTGPLTETIRPGETLSERLPLGAADARLVLPDSTRHDLVPAPDGRVAYGPIRSRGIYTLSWTGPASPTDVQADGRNRRALAANLLDPEESDIGTRAKLSLASREVAAQAETSTALNRKLWPYLLLAALAVAMLEWFIYNRKVYV